MDEGETVSAEDTLKNTLAIAARFQPKVGSLLTIGMAVDLPLLDSVDDSDVAEESAAAPSIVSESDS
jgi:hypothetical protein